MVSRIRSQRKSCAVDSNREGAGLYSFFQDYTQACIATSSCQEHILIVDGESKINIFSLSTVGTRYQLSIEGRGVIQSSRNRNGFASTVTSWTPARLRHYTEMVVLPTPAEYEYPIW
jgi:hypothetical protein